MSSQDCPDCGHVIKNNSGLNCHRKTYKVCLGQRYYQQPRENTERNTGSPIANQDNSSPTKEPFNQTFDDLYKSDGFCTLKLGGGSKLVMQDTENSTFRENHNGKKIILSESLGIASSSKVLSSLGAVKIESYKDVTGLEAETTIDASGLDITNSCNSETLGTEEYGQAADSLHLFLNKMDYTFAYWLHESGCTKGDVDQFFKDKRLQSMHKKLSFKNNNE